MTRKQNAIMDRKYKKVIVKSNNYAEKYDRALDIAYKDLSMPPSVRINAKELVKGM